MQSLAFLRADALAWIRFPGNVGLAEVVSIVDEAMEPFIDPMNRRVEIMLCIEDR